MIQARNVDYTTMIAYESSSTATTLSRSFANYLTVDVSKIPTGSKFIANFSVGASGSATLTAISARCNYNGTNGLEFMQATEWGKNVSGTNVFTKVSGVNNLYLQAKKDNDSGVNISNRICVCIVID